WRHPEVLTNGRGSARGSLLTVVRNLVTDRYRAKAARPQEVAENPDAPPIVRDHADSVVASVTVMAALEELSEDHRGVLDQIYFKGRSLGEAATALGIPAGTVTSRSYYALRALRQALAGTMSEGAGREVPARTATGPTTGGPAPTAGRTTPRSSAPTCWACSTRRSPARSRSTSPAARRADASGRNCAGWSTCSTTCPPRRSSTGRRTPTSCCSAPCGRCGRR